MCIRDRGNSIDLYVEVRSGTELDIGFMEVSVENYFMIRSIIPVSYTHLDVYKRQALGLHPSICGKS